MTVNKRESHEIPYLMDLDKEAVTSILNPFENVEVRVWETKPNEYNYLKDQCRIMIPLTPHNLNLIPSVGIGLDEYLDEVLKVGGAHDLYIHVYFDYRKSFYNYYVWRTHSNLSQSDEYLKLIKSDRYADLNEQLANMIVRKYFAYYINQSPRRLYREHTPTVTAFEFGVDVGSVTINRWINNGHIYDIQKDSGGNIISAIFKSFLFSKKYRDDNNDHDILIRSGEFIIIRNRNIINTMDKTTFYISYDPI